MLGTNEPLDGREYTAADVEFMMAMESYMRKNRRRFPAWTEVLDVALSLGYRQGAERAPLPTYQMFYKEDRTS